MYPLYTCGDIQYGYQRTKYFVDPEKGEHLIPLSGTLV